MIDWARKKFYCWLVRYYGFDKVLKHHGITDIEAYYDKLVKLLKLCKERKKKDCRLTDLFEDRQFIDELRQ